MRSISGAVDHMIMHVGITCFQRPTSSVTACSCLRGMHVQQAFNANMHLTVVKKRDEKVAPMGNHNRSLCLETVAARGYNHPVLVAYTEGLEPSS